MFADDRLVSFRGSRFDDLETFSCKYVDLDKVVVDRDIAGTLEQRKAFEQRLKGDSFDVFVSHASEDKTALARPLAQRLREMGFVVWLDESQIEHGEELIASLTAGMTRSRCGLVILSPAFMAKKWTQYEVEQLLEASRQSGKKLLFLWHGVQEAQVRAWSPQVADRVAIMTDAYSIDALAAALAKALH
jgi:ADP-heptose:LPS heptosyltransferase